ncbi:unnamed protein product [Dibothriocephalus latus]|uniref:Uncharacterized protein n=1 Tax=Dibothriocephalus latus TaxID=60516 RepID=A0A3P7NVK6_DIBLA|nr:unnamed protein product [Dibothriocephalus latus]
MDFLALPWQVILAILIYFCGLEKAVKFSNGPTEWGMLCNLNASEFDPGNVEYQSEIKNNVPLLYGSLAQLFKSAGEPPTNKSVYTKPCCFSEKWESGFIVHTRRIGRRTRGDLGHFRILRRPEGNPEAVLVIGQSVQATSLCPGYAGARLKTCPTDRASCLEIPHLGEPRCISEATGFQYMPRSDRTQEVWFTDSRISTGGIHRHIYTFDRRYGLCQLRTYQILTGQYVDAKRSCRMLFLEDRLIIPITGSFKINFTHALDQDLFNCKTAK